MIITLPWPNSGLNPNVRLHWAVKAKLKKMARYTAFLLAKEQQVDLSDMDAVNVKITFYPPDKRRRDRDNMISSFKSAQDGIADAVKIDDSQWIPQYFVEKPVKNGCVVVEFSRGKFEYKNTKAYSEMYAHHVSIASCKAILAVQQHMQIYNIDEEPEAFLTCVMMKTLREMMDMMPFDKSNSIMQEFIYYAADKDDTT